MKANFPLWNGGELIEKKLEYFHGIIVVPIQPISCW